MRCRGGGYHSQPARTANCNSYAFCAKRSRDQFGEGRSIPQRNGGFGKSRAARQTHNQKIRIHRGNQNGNYSFGASALVSEMELLKNLQQKPYKTRVKILWTAVLGAVLVLIIIWGVSVKFRARDHASGTSKFQPFWESVKKLQFNFKRNGQN